jgi:hypothetical protein
MYLLGRIQLIYQFEGSYGSRMHKNEAGLFIACAQWPSRERWEKSGSQLPEIAISYKNQLHEYCSFIEKVYELEMVNDLLQNKTFN